MRLETFFANVIALSEVVVKIIGNDYIFDVTNHLQYGRHFPPAPQRIKFHSKNQILGDRVNNKSHPLIF
jgi:hypothetical protein